MSHEDELLFGQAQSKDQFGTGKVTAAMKRERTSAVEAMDVADLIGAGTPASSGTGLDFGTQDRGAAKSPAAAPQPAPVAAATAPAAPVRRRPGTERRPGLLARLLALFGIRRGC
jgi:hypothetical protein